MKKLNRIKLVLIMFIMTIVITIPNVKAEINYATDETNLEIEHIIEGFEIRLYPVQKNENGKFDFPENFLSRTPTHTIPLDSATYTINEEYKTDKINTLPTKFIDLNLSVTKEEMEQLIKGVVPTLATEDEGYYGELVVKYKFTKLPSEYAYYYNYNYVDTMIAALTDPSYQLPQITLNNSVSQVINIISYIKEGEEDIINYETEITEENGLGGSILNCAVFSTKEITDLEFTQTPETDGQYAYMFHSVDNIEFLIESINNAYSEDTEEPTTPEDVIDEILNPTKPENTKTEQIVQVEDTGANISGIIYLISIIAIVIGGTIIYKETKIKEISQ